MDVNTMQNVSSTTPIGIVRTSETLSQHHGTFIDDGNYNATLPTPYETIHASTEDVVSGSALQTIEVAVNAWILPVLVLCGVTGNVINMAVFVRQGLRDRVNVCLFSLAFSDSGFLLAHLASRIYILFYVFDAAVGEFWRARWFFFIGVYHSFLNTSNSLTLVIALERCICVMSPLRAKNLLSARGMAIIVALLFAVNVAGDWQGCIKYRSVFIHNPVTNTTELRTTITEFYQMHSAWYDAVFEITFNVVIPTASLVVVMVATCVIASRLRTALAWRKDTAHVGTTRHESSSANQREASVTRMLFVVCVVYTVCITPTVVQALTRTFVRGFVAGGRFNNVFFASLVFTHLLESVNCSLNLVIYYTMSTRYRDTLRDMVQRRRGGKKAKQEQTTTVSSVM